MERLEKPIERFLLLPVAPRLMPILDNQEVASVRPEYFEIVIKPVGSFNGTSDRISSTYLCDNRSDFSRCARFDLIKTSSLFVVLALLLTAAYFSPHIWQHGEAREALVIQDIVDHHRWVLPLRNGELPSKPIL